MQHFAIYEPLILKIYIFP